MDKLKFRAWDKDAKEMYAPVITRDGLAAELRKMVNN